MSKSALVLKQSLSMTGTLNTESDEIVIELEEIGERNLRDLLKRFNSEHVKISISIQEEDPQD